LGIRELWIGVVLLVAAGCGRGGPAPNLLLIVLDTTRADAVAGYVDGGGEAEAYTPTLDELAATGVLFTQARSTSAWTVPSHGSLFTGLYPSRHGAHWEGGGLDAEQVTLAEVLAPAYERAGFSENPHIIRAKGYAQGFETYEETWRRRRSWDEPPITLELVAGWFQRRDRARPFFVFVNLMTPHLPYAPPLRHQRRFVPAELDQRVVERFKAVGEGQARLYMMGALRFPERDLEILRALYRAEVAFGDERIGRILDMVRSQGELDDTLVVVVGDHGENIGDHGLMEHQLCLYESVLRVPLIMRLPGVLDGGVRRDGPVQLHDVMPTVLDALGVPASRWPEMEGESLLDGDPAAERPVYAEYMRPLEQMRLFQRVNPGFDFTPFDRRLKSIQVGSLKLIVSDRGEQELYDVAADPDETRDLAAARPEDVRRLGAQLAAWTRDWKPRVASEVQPLDDDARRALQELGYIE
jgi:arylsulfatase A-like enzyme